MTAPFTIKQAQDNITFLYTRYAPSNASNLSDAFIYFDAMMDSGYSVTEAYKTIGMDLFYTAAFYDNAFPGHGGYANPYLDVDAIPGALIVDFYYPNATDSVRSALIEQIDRGAVAKLDFAIAWAFAAPENPEPTVQALFDLIVEHTDSTPALPFADLSFDGVSEAQLSTLVGTYLAAFGRAPEHDGLAWWAGEMASINARGGDALREIGVRFYEAGVSHGEPGTSMSNAEYVQYTYENVLGRAPEAAGMEYWVYLLDNGRPRGEMVVEFVNAAQNADREYLDARIAVSKHLAQEHVSGGTTHGSDFFVQALEGVNNAEDAYAAILEIIDTYGPSVKVAGAAEVLALNMPDDEVFTFLQTLEAAGFQGEQAYVADDAFTSADIELVGLSSDVLADLLAG